VRALAARSLLSGRAGARAAAAAAASGQAGARRVVVRQLLVRGAAALGRELARLTAAMNAPQ
jgi:hypothetical protein